MVLTRTLLIQVLRGLMVLFVLVSVTFFLTRTFSDPVRIMLPLDAGPEDYARLRSALGLDQPLLVQYGGFINDVLQGDFGQSLWMRRPALAVALERVPASLLLATGALGLALLIGVPLGVIAGVKPGSWADRLATGTSGLAVSVADFWLGILLILLFAVNLRWLPTGGYDGLTSLKFLILPVMTLAFRPLGRVALMVRETIVDEMKKSYVTTGLSKGLSRAQVVRRHVIKHAAIVIMTVLGYEYVFVFTGYAVGVEVVFGWPGLGKLAVDAVLHQDVILVAAIVIVSGALVVMVNTALDIARRLADPRLEG